MTDLDHASDVLSFLSKKWTMEVVSTLAQQELRHNELARAIGLTTVQLGRVLPRLQGAGMVAREIRSLRPVEITYRLTPRGRELIYYLQLLDKWWGDEVASAGFAEEVTGQLLEMGEPMSGDIR